LPKKYRDILIVAVGVQLNDSQKQLLSTINCNLSIQNKEEIMKIPQYVSVDEVKKVCKELKISDGTRKKEPKVSFKEAKVIPVSAVTFTIYNDLLTKHYCCDIFDSITEAVENHGILNFIHRWEKLSGGLTHTSLYL